MSFRIGFFVLHHGKLALIADEPGEDIYTIHYVDENGETVMKDHPNPNNVDPLNGNPQPRITDERVVHGDELTRATMSQIPESRRTPPQ